MSIRRRFARVLAALFLAASPWQAGAATFTVNSTADTSDGACGPSAGECTLREAIEAAVASAGRDTIVFDPGVFVLGTLTAITLATALPVVVDAAGTVIDGSGSSVSIDGGGTLGGLVFASAPGVPLRDVAVIRLRLFNLPLHSLHICGGVPPLCDADVSGALVRSVAAVGSGFDGIRIEGRNVSKAQVVDSVASSHGQSGIAVIGSESTVGTRVEGCTVLASDAGGIFLDGGGKNEASWVADTVAYSNDNRGIDIRGVEVAKTKLTNVVALGNGSDGIQVFAADSAASTAITNTAASQNVSAGIALVTTLGSTKTSLQDVTLDLNDFTGLYVGGPAAGLKIKRTALIENADGGVSLFEGSKPRISDVVAIANNTGLYLGTTGGKVKRVLGGGNAQDTVFFVEPASKNKLTKSFALGDVFSGILVEEGATANVIRKNVSLGNTTFDLSDGNPGCDAQTWAANVFGTSSDPCIH